MQSFSPVFSNVVDSSLWMEKDFVCKAFITLLAIKNSDHIARVNAFGLGRKCWPLEPEIAERRAMEALDILMSPDTKRIEPQANEGRRIQKVDDGYLVLNGQFYEDQMRLISRKAYKARWERNKRADKRKPRIRSDDKPSSAAYRAAEMVEVRKFENGEPSECE